MRTTSCLSCPSPTTSLASGAINCSACIEGYYWDHRVKLKEDEGNRLGLLGLGACESCPQGIDCTNSSYRFLETLFVKKGYFRFSSTAKAAYKCDSIKDNKKQCVGGSATGKALCNENAEGPLCSRCEEDFTRPAVATVKSAHQEMSPSPLCGCLQSSVLCLLQ